MATGLLDWRYLERQLLLLLAHVAGILHNSSVLISSSVVGRELASGSQDVAPRQSGQWRNRGQSGGENSYVPATVTRNSTVPYPKGSRMAGLYPLQGGSALRGRQGHGDNGGVVLTTGVCGQSECGAPVAASKETYRAKRERLRREKQAYYLETRDTIKQQYLDNVRAWLRPIPKTRACRNHPRQAR